MITADEVWNVMRDHGIIGVMEWMHPNHSLLQDEHNRGQHKYLVRLGDQFFRIHFYDQYAGGGHYVWEVQPMLVLEFWETREDN